MDAVSVRLVRLVLVATLSALCLAGCGRKGPLEPPPSASLTQVDPNAPAAETDNSVLFPGGGQSTKHTAPAPKPLPKDFFLDWLIR